MRTRLPVASLSFRADRSASTSALSRPRIRPSRRGSDSMHEAQPVPRKISSTESHSAPAATGSNRRANSAGVIQPVYVNGPEIQRNPPQRADHATVESVRSQRDLECHKVSQLIFALFPNGSGKAGGTSVIWRG